MAFDWQAIDEIEHPETRLYRLIGEMLRGKASFQDLERVALFLQKAGVGPEAWHTVGEALHTTTRGSVEGYRLWAAWSKRIPDVTSNDEELGIMWRRFGGELIFAEDDCPTDEIDPTAVDGFDLAESSVSHTALISFTNRTLMSYVPEGTYSIRFIDEEFHGVDELSIIKLVRRGILLGAEVLYRGTWIPVATHPDFEPLTRMIRAEVRRVLERSALETTTEKNRA